MDFFVCEISPDFRCLVYAIIWSSQNFIDLISDRLSSALFFYPFSKCYSKFSSYSISATQIQNFAMQLVLYVAYFFWIFRQLLWNTRTERLVQYRISWIHSICISLSVIRYRRNVYRRNIEFHSASILELAKCLTIIIVRNFLT